MSLFAIVLAAGLVGTTLLTPASAEDAASRRPRKEAPPVSRSDTLRDRNTSRDGGYASPRTLTPEERERLMILFLLLGRQPPPAQTP